MDMDDFVGEHVEEGLDLSFQVGVSKVHGYSDGQVGFLVHPHEFLGRIHQKPVFCWQVFQGYVYAIFLGDCIKLLDALAHRFEISTGIELSDACALPRVKYPHFSVDGVGVG